MEHAMARHVSPQSRPCCSRSKEGGQQRRFFVLKHFSGFLSNNLYGNMLFYVVSAFVWDTTGWLGVKIKFTTVPVWLFLYCICFCHSTLLVRGLHMTLLGEAESSTIERLARNASWHERWLKVEWKVVLVEDFLGKTFWHRKLFGSKLLNILGIVKWWYINTFVGNWVLCWWHKISLNDLDLQWCLLINGWQLIWVQSMALRLASTAVQHQSPQLQPKQRYLHWCHFVAGLLAIFTGIFKYLKSFQGRVHCRLFCQMHCSILDAMFDGNVRPVMCDRMSWVEWVNQLFFLLCQLRHMEPAMARHVSPQSGPLLFQGQRRRAAKTVFVLKYFSGFLSNNFYGNMLLYVVSALCMGYNWLIGR